MEHGVSLLHEGAAQGSVPLCLAQRILELRLLDKKSRSDGGATFHPFCFCHDIGGLRLAGNGWRMEGDLPSLVFCLPTHRCSRFTPCGRSHGGSPGGSPGKVSRRALAPPRIFRVPCRVWTWHLRGNHRFRQASFNPPPLLCRVKRRFVLALEG